MRDRGSAGRWGVVGALAMCAAAVLGAPSCAQVAETEASNTGAGGKPDGGGQAGAGAKEGGGAGAAGWSGGAPGGTGGGGGNAGGSGSDGGGGTGGGSGGTSGSSGQGGSGAGGGGGSDAGGGSGTGGGPGGGGGGGQGGSAGGTGGSGGSPPGCTSDGDCSAFPVGACQLPKCSGGSCKAAAAADGTPCDDKNACTATSSCQGGACKGGAPIDCDDKNACTDDACDALSGCQHANNTAPCDDGNACTVNDKCSGGACKGQKPAEACNLKDDDCNGACDDGAACRTGVHRSYSAKTGEHFYTTNASEAACCGFAVETMNFYWLYASSQAGLVPFYRCYLSMGKHFYTTSPTCEGAAGTNEGAMGYIATSPVCGSTPLYRLVKSGNGDHFYTTSASERDQAIQQLGYVSEGEAGHVWTSP